MMTDETKAEIERLAEASLEAEVCGYVVDVSGAEVIVPCKNVHAEPQRRFAVSKEDAHRAHELGRVRFFYHSHVAPGTTEAPSEADRLASDRLGIPYVVYCPARKAWGTHLPTGRMAPLEGRVWIDGVLDCYSLVQDYFSALRQCVECSKWRCYRLRGFESCVCGSESFGPPVFEFPDVERGTYLYSTPEELKQAGAMYLDYVPRCGWVEVPQQTLRLHDGILLQFAGVVTHHAAIYLGDRMILHHPHNGLSRREPLSVEWERRVTHNCRHQWFLKIGDLWRPFGEREWRIYGE